MKRYIVTDVKAPWTSNRWHQATYKTKVYDFVVATADVGANRREIAAGTNLNVGRVSSYLAELKRDGLIKRIGDAVDPSTLSPEDATLHAMSAMENALVITAQKHGVTPEMEKAFAFYQKVKARVLLPQGSTEPELKQAMRLALVSLVKLIY